MMRNSFGHRLALFLACILGFMVCRKHDDPVRLFNRLADTRSIVVHDVGSVWQIPGDQIKRTPPSRGEDTIRNDGVTIIRRGTLEIPVGSIFLGVDFTVGSERNAESGTMLIHLFEDEKEEREVEGFPLRISHRSERQVLCEHRYNPPPFHWRAEYFSSSVQRSNDPPDFTIRGRYARAKTLVPGLQHLRASGETRPSLLFTPGTTISAALPAGDGWIFAAGIAQPVVGCTVSLSIRSSTGDSLLAVFRTPEWAWHDSSIFLPKLSPCDSLYFECHSPKGNGVLILGDPVIRKASPISGDRPNILMISLDTVRADALEPWAQQNAAPGIGAFSREAVVFMNAYAPAPVTDASHRSLFCGLLANRHTHLCQERGFAPPHIRMLTEVLSDYGYRTGGFTDGGLISSAYGFHRGFDRYWEYSGDPRNKVHLHKILKLAAQWIMRENSSSRWFTFIHTYQAHSPYVLHEEKGAPAVNVSVIARMEETIPLRHQATLNSQKIATEREVIGVAKRHYQSEIRYLDTYITMFIESLTKKGFLDNTIVVILSDHGEGFGEHGLLGHNNSIYEEQVRIPLIFRFPDDRFAGRKIDQTVRLIDVFPTLLEYLNIAEVPGIDGQSLLPVISRDGSGHRPVIAHQLWHSSVIVWPYKLIAGRNGFTTRLYDLSRDPAERHNILPGAEKQLIDSLKQRLIDGFVESEYGWMIRIPRPPTGRMDFVLTSPDCSGWSLFFTEESDEIEQSPDHLRLSLVPSKAGTVSLFVPTLDTTQIETGGEIRSIDDQHGVAVGGVHIGITHCGGESPDLYVDRVNYLTFDGHDEQLKALGYIQ